MLPCESRRQLVCVACSDGLTTLAEMAGWLGRTADQAKYSAHAEALKAKINQLMFNGSAFCDGTCAAEHPTILSLSMNVIEVPERGTPKQVCAAR